MSNNYDFQSLKSLIGDEALNNDNYYRDPSHVSSIQDEISNGIKDEISVELAKWIRQKNYGIDVREALARFAEWISVRTTEAERGNKIVTNQQKDLTSLVNDFIADFTNRYNTQVAGNTNLNEVIDARTSLLDGPFDTLNSRLNNIEKTRKRKNNKEIDFLDYGFIPNDSGAEAHNNALFAKLMLEEGSLSLNVSAGNRFWIGNVTVSRGEFSLYGGGTITGNLICDEGYSKNHIFISDITFKFDSMSENNNPIVLSEVTRSAVKNCYFLNCNKAISYKSIDHAQHVSRISIDNNYMRNVNYGLYGVRPESFEQLLIAADIHFTNNIVENCFVEHVHVEGWDGGIISNNTLFFPSHSVKSKDKQNNIYMKWLEWTVISNNNIFESGKDGIHLERAEHVTISGNNIAWAGQNQPGSGIKIINYSKAGGIVVKGTITGNMIDQPSESGIYIDDNAGYVTVSANEIYDAGSTKYYYGEDEVIQKWGVYLGQTSQGVVVTGNNISHSNIQNSGTVNVLKGNLTLNNTGHTSDVVTKNYEVTIQSGQKIANFATGLNTDSILGIVVFYNDTNYNTPATAYLNPNSTINLVASSNVSQSTKYTVRVSYRRNIKE